MTIVVIGSLRVKSATHPAVFNTSADDKINLLRVRYCDLSMSVVGRLSIVSEQFALNPLLLLHPWAS